MFNFLKKKTKKKRGFAFADKKTGKVFFTSGINQDFTSIGKLW